MFEGATAGKSRIVEVTGCFDSYHKVEGSFVSKTEFLSITGGGPIKRRIKTDAIRIELTITFQVKLRLTNRNTFGREIILFEQLISHAVLTTSRFDHALEVI